MFGGVSCRWRSRLRRLGQSRRFQGAVNTSSKDIGGKSARLLERHRQVEAFDPGDAAIAQRSLVSRRTRWSCDLEVGAWAVGRLAPSTFPPVGAGGLAHLGSRRLPRMRSLADLITAAVHKEGVVQGVQTRALVRDSTYIERGLASPLRSVTRARHSVAVHVRMSVDARAASRQQPRQRSGSPVSYTHLTLPTILRV